MLSVCVVYVVSGLYWCGWLIACMWLVVRDCVLFMWCPVCIGVVSVVCNCYVRCASVCECVVV